MTRATLAALVARIEQGEAGRELDAEIGRAAGVPCETASLIGRVYTPIWARFTESIDAQAALPGQAVSMTVGIKDGQDWFVAEAIAARQYAAIYAEAHQGEAPTEAGARLAALLRAMMNAADS